MIRTVFIAALVLIPAIVPPVISSQTMSAIEGTVLETETNLPLANVQVGVFTGNTMSQTATTDARGRFSIENVPPGRFHLVPAKEGYAFWNGGAGKPGPAGRYIRLTNGQELRDIELSMAPTAAISGRLTDRSGAPVTGATIVLLQRRYDADGIIGLTRITPGNNLRTNDLGEYRFFDVVAGAYHIMALGAPMSIDSGDAFLSTYYPGSSDPDASQPVIVRPGEEVRLPDIVRQQAPVVPVRLRLTDVDPIGPPPRPQLFVGDVIVDFGSRFGEDPDLIEVLGVAHGRFQGILYWLARTGPVYGRIDLTAAGTAAIQYEILPQTTHMATVELYTEDADGQLRPATGVRCILHHEMSGLSQICGGGSSNFRLAEGRYSLQVTEPADAHVTAMLGPGEELLDAFRVAGDGTYRVILSQNGARVEGTVRDDDNQPVPDAVVALVPDPPLRQAGYLYRSTLSDVAGNFELSGIAPGSYRLFAWDSLPGDAYKNADFMGPYDQMGTAISIGKNEEITADATLAEIWQHFPD